VSRATQVAAAAVLLALASCSSSSPAASETLAVTYRLESPGDPDIPPTVQSGLVTYTQENGGGFSRKIDGLPWKLTQTVPRLPTGELELSFIPDVSWEILRKPGDTWPISCKIYVGDKQVITNTSSAPSCRIKTAAVH
jgi:hypothetical protein